MIPLADLERYGPSMRRAARALTGLPPALADAFVRDALRRSLVCARPHAVAADVWMLRLLVDAVRLRPALNEAQPGETNADKAAAALDALPRDLREALVMVVVERLAYADAAFVLDVPLDALVDRLTRARDCFGQALRGEAAQPPPRVEGRRFRLVK